MAKAITISSGWIHAAMGKDDWINMEPENKSDMPDAQRRWGGGSDPDKPKVPAKLLAVLAVILALVIGYLLAEPREPDINVPETTASTQPTEPTETLRPTEEYPTEPRITAPTEPEPTNPMLPSHMAFPDLPAVEGLQERPEGLNAGNFVETVYQNTMFWSDVYWSAEMPAFLPISEEAMAINQEIYELYQSAIISARYYYSENISAGSKTLAYDVSTIGTVTTLRVFEISPRGEKIRFYTLDSETGKAPDVLKMVKYHDPGLEYPQFLCSLSEKAESSFYTGKDGITVRHAVRYTLHTDNDNGVFAYVASSDSVIFLKDIPYVDADAGYQWLMDAAEYIKGVLGANYIKEACKVAFLDGPERFLRKTSERASLQAVSYVRGAGTELTFAVAKEIMNDPDESYPLRCRAYLIAEKDLSEQEHLAFWEGVYDACSDGGNGLTPEGKALVHQFYTYIPYNIISILEKKELAGRRETVNATWKVCYTETAGGYGMGQQYGTDAVEILDYQKFRSYVTVYTEDTLGLGVKADITNAQCPESLVDVAATITEAFFEENVLFFMHHYDVKDTAPVVTKIDYDSNSYRLNPYQIHLDCVDGNEKGNMATYVILITIPKEQYHAFPEDQQFAFNVWQNVGCVVNGNPIN